MHPAPCTPTRVNQKNGQKRANSLKKFTFLKKVLVFKKLRFFRVFARETTRRALRPPNLARQKSNSA